MSDQERIQEPIEVEPSVGLKIAHDPRPPMVPLPPVRVMAVADVHLPAAAGLETELDAFYVALLKFDRVGQSPLAYRAENFSIIFDVLEPPVQHEALVPTQIQVPSLSLLREELAAREIEFELVRGLIPGHQHLSLQDPAGNWLDIAEWRVVR